MDSLRQDIRYAVRVLARRPLFTLAVAATLALGIGANSAIFSFVNAVLLRPLPYPEPERLMAVWTMLPEFGKETSSYPDFGDWSARSRSFSSMSAFARSSDNLSGTDGEPERLSSAIATPNLFATLGVTPVIGRLLVAGDSAWGSHRVVVLSHRLWQRRYGGSSDILGQSIQLNATPYTVVGVAPPDMVIAPGAFGDDGRQGEWPRHGADAPKRALPLLQGGKQPGGLQAYRDAVGSDDYLLNVASWLDVHPGGIEAAAREFRAAIDARRAA